MLCRENKPRHKWHGAQAPTTRKQAMVVVVDEVTVAEAVEVAAIVVVGA